MGTRLTRDAAKQTIPLSIQTATSSASIGTEAEISATRPTEQNTYVPGAAPQTTELLIVLKQRQSKANTPLKHEGWVLLLYKHGLYDKYEHIPRSILIGFNTGIPHLHFTYTPANSPSLHVYHDEFNTIVQKEFNKGRCLGPLNRQQAVDLVGPFHSSPLSLLDKPGKPGKHCLVQNLSFPQKSTTRLSTPSINSYIDSNNYPCTWGTFNVICRTIWELPPGSEGACRDVAEAYRNIPLHPSQWPGVVVQIAPEVFALDTCVCFGLRSAGGIYGPVGDAAADIFRMSGIGPLSKWVDDHVLFRIMKVFCGQYYIYYIHLPIIWQGHLGSQVITCEPR